jgi:GT2 family glycosyltransferase/glycosyltransferase involved in cell wall biosynthesis
VNVDVLIVTHESAAHIERAIGALVPHCTTVVVDNASTDGTVGRARRAGADVVVENDVNAGFAAAANHGARLGTAEYLLFLNPDAMIHPDQLDRLVRGAAQSDLAIAAPRVHYDNGTDQRVSWPFPSAAGAWREALGIHRLMSEPSDGFVVGACFLVRRAAFEQLGGFDTRYWLYGEEADLCRRARDAGLRIGTVDDAVALHAGGASGAGVPDLVFEHFTRGGERFVVEGEGTAALVGYRLANLVGAALRSVLVRGASARTLHRNRVRRNARALVSHPTSVDLDSPATASTTHTLVVCSLEPWDDVWRRNQFFVRELLQRDPNLRVLFVEPPFDWLHHVRGHRDRERVRGIRSPRPDGRLFVFEPFKLLPRALGGLADRSLERQVRRAAREVGFARPTLWVNDPNYARLVVRTSWPSVYDITDDWISSAPSTRLRRRLERRERQLLRDADSVVVCSDALARRRRPARADVSVTPNAVDVEHFQRPRPRPTDLPNRATAIYVGSLHDSRIDVALVTQLARAIADLEIVLIGPNSLSTASLDQLATAGNVRILGQRPYEDVPAYLQHAAVIIVPHVVSDFTESLDPIKAYECLAVGRPTVATPVAGFRGLPEPVRVAAREDFVATVARALTDPTAAAATSLPSWRDRAEQFDQALTRARHNRGPIE